MSHYSLNYCPKSHFLSWNLGLERWQILAVLTSILILKCNFTFGHLLYVELNLCWNLSIIPRFGYTPWRFSGLEWHWRNRCFTCYLWAFVHFMLQIINQLCPIWKSSFDVAIFTPFTTTQRRISTQTVLHGISPIGSSPGKRLSLCLKIGLIEGSKLFSCGITSKLWCRCLVSRFYCVVSSLKLCAICFITLINCYETLF